METQTEIIVRYAETDQMGIVHHSVYAVWFEAARTDFLKQSGMSYSEMEKKGLWMPVIGLECQFKSPAHYEDEIIIKTRIADMTHVKIKFAYDVINAKNSKLLVTGTTTHAFTTPNMKPIAVERKFPEICKAIKSLM